jgi:hypothetical protein
VGRAWFVAAVLALSATTGAACGDDGEDATGTASQEAWDAEAARLCEQHGSVIARAYNETVPDSDAEEAAFYTTDFVPRTRALIRGLADLGLPAEREEQYRTALNDALDALGQIEADPFGYIDERHAQETPPEEDLLNRIRAGLTAADIPC